MLAIADWSTARVAGIMRSSAGTSAVERSRLNVEARLAPLLAWCVHPLQELSHKCFSCGGLKFLYAAATFAFLRKREADTAAPFAE